MYVLFYSIYFLLRLTVFQPNNMMLVPGVQHSNSDIYRQIYRFCSFFSIEEWSLISYDRILSIVPCSIQFVVLNTRNSGGYLLV